jgi:hypothetical protein
MKILLNGSYSKVHIVKNLSDAFAIQNGLKKEMCNATGFQLYFGMHHQERPRTSGRTGIELNTTAPALC